MVVIVIVLMFRLQEEHQVLHQTIQVDVEPRGEINMSDYFDKHTPKNFLPSIKENFKEGWNIWWGLHKKVGRFLLFMAPVLILEFIVLFLIKQYTGVEIER